MEGKTIQMPHYNFKEGRRDRYFDFHVESDEIILIDCLHGLYQRHLLPQWELCADSMPCWLLLPIQVVRAARVSRW